MAPATQLSRNDAAALLYPAREPREIGIYGVTFKNVHTGQPVDASGWFPHNRPDLREHLKTLLTGPDWEFQAEWVIEPGPYDGE